MKTILIAEDDPPSAELLLEFLTLFGYRVTVAADGAQAVRMLAEIIPDLILLDSQMPVLDGFAVLGWVRGQPRLSRVPVAAVTGCAIREDRERILKAGFDAFIPKPLDAASLAAQVEGLLALGTA
jgi:two-component system cell cycle response regulator DivK